MRPRRRTGMWAVDAAALIRRPHRTHVWADLPGSRTALARDQAERSATDKRGKPISVIGHLPAASPLSMQVVRMSR